MRNITCCHYSHKDCFTHTHTHTHTLSLSLSLSLTHPPSAPFPPTPHRTHTNTRRLRPQLQHPEGVLSVPCEAAALRRLPARPRRPAHASLWHGRRAQSVKTQGCNVGSRELHGVNVICREQACILLLHMTCMYPPPHMTCMYPELHGVNVICREQACILLLI